MASLKEVRARISSVTSTRKITSAMKLVSAAKLRRAQDAITNYLPYQKNLTRMLEDFVASSTEGLSIPLAQQREVKRIAVVAVSSNSSLCGAFNSNAIKRTETVLTQYAHLKPADVLIYPIGKRISEVLSKKGYNVQGDYNALLDNTDYDKVAALVDELMNLFLQKQVDRVELVYNHFKNAAVQEIRCESLLPISPEVSNEKHTTADYILEPDKDYVLLQLVPKVVRLHLYSALLDSIAAECGARTTAMQVATDNAQDLIQDLTLKYNKARQAAITSEIIDIVGGSEVLK